MLQHTERGGAVLLLPGYELPVLSVSSLTPWLPVQPPCEASRHAHVTLCTGYVLIVLAIEFQPRAIGRLVWSCLWLAALLLPTCSR